MKRLILLALCFLLFGCELSTDQLFLDATKNSEELLNYTVKIESDTDIDGLKQKVTMIIKADMDSKLDGIAYADSNFDINILGIKTNMSFDTYFDISETSVDVYNNLFSEDVFTKDVININEFNGFYDDSTAIDPVTGFSHMVSSFEVVEDNTMVNGVKCHVYKVKFNDLYYEKVLERMNAITKENSLISDDKLNPEEMAESMTAYISVDVENQLIINVNMDITGLFKYFLDTLGIDMEVNSFKLSRTFYDFDKTVVELPENIS